MILAAEINKYATLDRYDLATILARSGYSGIGFESAKFLGVTNGGDFCYAVQYFDDSGTGEVEVAKVYINKSATGDMTAEF
jgi:predicted sugar kinase